MFWKKKKSESDSVVWKDKTGKITCPGDACPNDCDNNCPIWLNTSGLQFLLQKQPQQAIKLFQRAISIAPDFPDAVNNLASAYGHINQHEKAYEYFKKALAMKEDYQSAIRGIIVAAKNLENYEEALKYCDAYDRLPGCNAVELRQDIQKRMNDNLTFSQKYGNWLILAEKLLQIGRNEGYIHSVGFPQIPELLACAEPTCIKILNAEAEYEKDHPNVSEYGRIKVIYYWSALAGIGAVYHWNNDWDTLSQEGIFEALTKERGFNEMDEYVLETVGISFESDQRKELYNVFDELLSECSGYISYEKTDVYRNTLLLGAKAMYAFGMVFEMNRLGMK